VSASLPPLCPGLEALVSDEIDGPDPWGQGEVIKFATSLSQGALTNNLSPLGTPNLDSPEDMAFDLNGNVVTADEGISSGVSQVVRVDRNTGVRTLISGPGLGSGPALNGPYSIATGVLGNVLKVDGGSGARTLFATYTASSPPSNYSLLMRPLILLPGGGGPSGPSGPGGGGGGGGL
jgi:hypothetical protein